MSKLRNSLVKMSVDLLNITENLKYVREKMHSAALARSEEISNLSSFPNLVAVTKTKPIECIIQAYKDGQRNFGENYVQELIEKSTNPEFQIACPDIKWHFIGHLQKNKISKMMSILDNLHAIETVDSEGLAKALNDSITRKDQSKILNVFVQVNTSGEESKSGIEQGNCLQLVKYVIEECSQLKFKGLMTIGAIDFTPTEPNSDFKTLFNLRETICKEFKLNQQDVELSMGMSGDFEEAIQMGSTNVRIGSTIFGPRMYRT